MTISAGAKLGHYQIISRIGKGGMGEVYLAQDTRLDRKAALKFLTPEFASDRGRMDRFIQEAKAASALNHPNILTIYEVGSIRPVEADGITEDLHYISSEFIDGQTLRERIRSSSINIAEALDIAIQVAGALSAAHAAGIVHRDIKPENIMLRKDGIVKVVDFGLAKLTEQAPSESMDTQAETRGAVYTDANVVMGTVIYMSPEQARGIPVDSRTDIFSLGIVIYEMITGRIPFEGASLNEILASILNDQPATPLARYANNVPAELERIVAKALRKNRDERYQNVKDVLLDLTSLKQDLAFEKRVERTASNSRVSSTTVTTPTPRKRQLAWIAPAILMIGLAAVYYASHRSPNSAAIDSIAVLPFENMTHDQKTEYLSDGITESLINSLSQLPHTKVISRYSVFNYKNQKPNLQDVAKQLNVRAVLTGRVLMEGDTLDVRVELTDAPNNTELWGDHYTRKASDIFSVQDQIAQQVTDTLRVRLSGEEQQQVTKRYTENSEAYSLFLQGRYLMNDFSEQNATHAITFFDKAIAADPNYALAYAARADAYFNLGDLSLPMNVANPKAKLDAETALKMDDQLVEARTTLATIEFAYDWNFARAEQDLKKAIALNPNYAEAHHQLGWVLAMTGRTKEALPEVERAQQLDPVNPQDAIDVVLPYVMSGQHEKAVAVSRKTLEMFPNFFIAHMTLGTSLINQGDVANGLAELEKAKALETTPHLLGTLGFYYGKTGHKAEALKLLGELEELSKHRYVASYWIGMIHLGLGEKDTAFEYFEKAYQERSWWLVFLKMDPMLDGLHGDARYEDLLNRVGFPK